VLSNVSMTSGLFYKNNRSIIHDSTSINDDRKWHSKWWHHSLTTLELPIMLLENIYSAGITHDNCHLMIVKYLQYRSQTSLSQCRHFLLIFNWKNDFVVLTLSCFSCFVSFVHLPFIFLWPWPGKPYWRLRVSTFDLHIEISCFVNKKNIRFQYWKQLIWIS